MFDLHLIKISHALPILRLLNNFGSPLGSAARHSHRSLEGGIIAVRVVALN
ncbi:hypothetical protein SAMN02745866_01039 [Alteromonadaceae bacterium Bs31]|nr:hypothetical protein SAMN02745866_01039 [Alteromonadaceae bacterium Bs31]